MESPETPSAHDILDDALEGRTGSEVASRLRDASREIDDAPVQQTLQATAKDIEQVLGGIRTGKLDAGVAGQAHQGQGGSSVVDISSTVVRGSDGASMVDKQWLKDIKEHELEHERQAVTWNAESVSVGVKELTRKKVSELGGMFVQDSIEMVSDEYKAIYMEVTSVVTAKEARDAARTGDLIGLGKKASKRMVVAEEPDYATVG